MSIKDKLITGTVAVIVFLFAIFSVPAQALNFVTFMNYQNPKTLQTETYMIVDGGIGEGDSELFKKTYRSRPDVKGVAISSNGGMILEGIKIADFVYENKIKVIVPPTKDCDSACAIIFLASPEKTMYVSGRVGLHRAHALVQNEKGQFEKREDVLSNAWNTIILTKLEKWNIPEEIKLVWMSTDPGDVTYLDAPTVLKQRFDIQLLMDPKKFPFTPIRLDSETK